MAALRQTQILGIKGRENKSLNINQWRDIGEVVKSVSLNMALSGSMYNEYKEVALA
jgi:hypothetical protein